MALHSASITKISTNAKIAVAPLSVSTKSRKPIAKNAVVLHSVNIVNEKLTAKTAMVLLFAEHLVVKQLYIIKNMKATASAVSYFSIQTSPMLATTRRKNEPSWSSYRLLSYT
jgi:hypothetical protein